MNTKIEKKISKKTWLWVDKLSWLYSKIRRKIFFLTTKDVLTSLQKTTHEKGKISVILFGGTFYPWHKGHQYCIDHFFDHQLKTCTKSQNLPSLNPSLVVIFPDSNPWKVQEKSKNMFFDQLKQVTLLWLFIKKVLHCLYLDFRMSHYYLSHQFSEQFNQKKKKKSWLWPQIISPISLEPTFVSDWLPDFQRELQIEFLKDQIFINRWGWIMGDDVLMSLYRWKNPDLFLNAIQDLWVYERDMTVEILESYFLESRTFPWMIPALIKKWKDGNIHFLKSQSEIKKISSTKIKKRAGLNKINLL